MFSVVVRVNKKVVHVDDEPSFCNHIPERIGHESLKRGGGSCHAKEHDCWFVEASVGNEGGLPLVAFLDADVVVSPSYVKLGKDFGVLEFVDEV